MAGLELDDWQQWSLTQSLGERPDGKWASFGVGVVVPRQNGKGGLLEARELAGLFLLGERLIIHSAHQFDTSQEAFERLVALIEGSPTLSKRLAKNGISRSHGSEGVKLKTGQRIRFRTRTKGGGRGFTADCLILDEAMIIPDAFMGAVLPVLSSRPNPQVWYTGSAVDQEIHEYGLVLARVRERGMDGNDPSLFYAEWSAADSVDDITPEMVDDPASWAAANPALGIRISPEYVANERREFGTNLRGFAVERLGIGDWPSTKDVGQTIISAADWGACVDVRSTAGDALVLACDVTPDRSWSTIAVAGEREDGLVHVEVIDHRRGTGWVVDRLTELHRKWRPGAVVCDLAGPAGSLAAEFERQRLNVTPVTGAEYAQACGMVFDAITEGTVRHLDTPELNAAVEGAATRSLRDAWAWSRRSTAVDISPLVAVTLAHWGAKTAAGGTAHVFTARDLVDVPAEGQEGQQIDGFRVLSQAETTTLRVPPRR